MDDDIEAQTIWLLEPMHLGGGGVFGMPGLPPDMSVKIGNVGRWPTGGGHTVELRFSHGLVREEGPPHCNDATAQTPWRYVYRARVAATRQQRHAATTMPMVSSKDCWLSLSFSLALFSPLSFSSPLLFLFLSLVIIAPPARNLSLFGHRVCGGGAFKKNYDVSKR